jgi:dipeptidyl aminopeptidase/acylaminoacyl peptidase
MASRGYAVLQVNYRGSDGFGWEFMSAGFGQFGRKMQTDLSDGVRYLGAQGVIHPKRVCIVGASYGGYAALAGVTVQHGLYRCAVSISGVSDVGGILAYSGDSDRSPVGRDNQRKFGVRSAEDESLRRISPVRLAASADAPILLIHGKDDTVVPFVHSASMATALEKLGKTYKLVATEGEDHYLSRAATRTQTITESVAWVEKYDPVQ